jgi:hypothetical protein
MSTTPEQIAEWAERQDEKKPTGVPGHLSAQQKQHIRVEYLATGGTLSYTEMGRRCASLIGRAVNRETVAACMKGPEYDALRKHYDSEIKATAVERLKAGILGAADAWVRSVEVASEKGDHKPAKDLLMHTGTIEPLDDDGRAKGPLVLVMVDSMPGLRGYVAPTLPPAIESDVYPECRPASSLPRKEPLWSDARTYTREEKEELLSNHEGTHVQFGIDASDVTMCLEPRVLQDAATGRQYTRAEAEELATKRDVATIGVQLPGLGLRP